MDRLICHVRYINNLTQLRSFKGKLLYLAVFSCISWELSVNRNLKNRELCPENLRTMLGFDIERGLFSRVVALNVSRVFLQAS